MFMWYARLLKLLERNWSKFMWINSINQHRCLWLVSIFDLQMIAGVLSLVGLRVDSLWSLLGFFYLFLIVVSKVVKAVVLGIHSRPFWLLFPGL